MSAIKHTADLEPTFGPRMLALGSDRMRRFVLALFHTRTHAEAAREAGYSAATLKTAAYNLLQNEKIQAAIDEERPRQVRQLAPDAIAATRRLIRNDRHRDHARSLALVLDRCEPVRTAVDIAVEHMHVHRASPEQIEQIYERIRQLTKDLGAPSVPQIEGTAVEVEP